MRAVPKGPTTVPAVRRVVHVITGLTRGGAEMMLYKLLSRLDRSRFESAVICLREEGPVADRIRKLGVPVESVGMGARVSDVRRLLLLRARLRKRAPDLVQTWLYHADLAGGLAAKLFVGVPVVWGIRMSRVDPLAFKRPTIAVARLCAWLSPWIPDRIVCCSETGRRNHAEFGYDQRKMIVIPNGFDTDELHPDEAARGSVRDELGVPHPSPLIGLVARFDAHKDHETFVRAAGLVRERFPEARYLLVGHGIDRQNAALARWIETAGIRDACHLLGVRDDVARLTAACDVAVSSSFGEGFSNAIGEAMACGVPCAVTDVGDSSWIIGDTGRVVPPRKPEALADAICELLSLDAGARRRLGEAARRRVVESFELSSIVRRYEDLYTELTDHVRR